MTAQRECIALLDGDDTSLKVTAFKEVGKHLHSLSATHQFQSRISLQHPGDKSRVVGLHVVGHQIVGLATIECGLQVCLPRFSFATVGSVHDRDLLVVDKIGVITHAFRHHILTLKQIDVKIVDTDVLNGITYHIHCFNYSLPFPSDLLPTRVSSGRQSPGRCCC